MAKNVRELRDAFTSQFIDGDTALTLVRRVYDRRGGKFKTFDLEFVEKKARRNQNDEVLLILHDDDDRFNRQRPRTGYTTASSAEILNKQFGIDIAQLNGLDISTGKPADQWIEGKDFIWIGLKEPKLNGKRAYLKVIETTEDQITFGDMKNYEGRPSLYVNPLGFPLSARVDGLVITGFREKMNPSIMKDGKGSIDAHVTSGGQKVYQAVKIVFTPAADILLPTDAALITTSAPVMQGDKKQLV